MLDVFALYARPADEAAFDVHYRDVHAPLTLVMPGLLEFSWSTAREGETYAVARMVFASREAADAGFASAEGAAAAADLANFAGAGVQLVFAERR